jgi:hypothetical protein
MRGDWQGLGERWRRGLQRKEGEGGTCKGSFGCAGCMEHWLCPAPQPETRNPKPETQNPKPEMLMERLRGVWLQVIELLSTVIAHLVEGEIMQVSVSLPLSRMLSLVRSLSLSRARARAASMMLSLWLPSEPKTPCLRLWFRV